VVAGGTARLPQLSPGPGPKINKLDKGGILGIRNSFLQYHLKIWISELDSGSII
jgi:hypothetical protein